MVDRGFALSDLRISILFLITLSYQVIKMEDALNSFLMISKSPVCSIFTIFEYCIVFPISGFVHILFASLGLGMSWYAGKSGPSTFR